MPILNTGLSDNDEIVAAMLIACQQKLQTEKADQLLLAFLENPLKTGPYGRLAMKIAPDKREGSKEFEYYFKAVNDLRDYVKSENASMQAQAKKIIAVIRDPKYFKKLNEIAKAQKREAAQAEVAQEASRQREQTQLDNIRRKSRQTLEEVDVYKKREQAARDSGAAAKLEKFLHITFQKEYKDSLNQKNWAQTIRSYKTKRSEQTDLIDDIKLKLLKEPKLQDVVKAEILYGALQLLKKDLEAEFRWTRWLGTKSRLEKILTKDMENLRKDFPGIEGKSQEKLRDFAKQYPDLKITESYAGLRQRNR